MKKGLSALMMCLLFSCSESTTNNNVEVLEKWENGVVKKDRVRLAADTFIVNHYHQNYKLHISGKAFYIEGEEIKHGTWIAHYPDGKKWSLNNFDRGVENGEYKTWFKNGVLNLSGQYSQGSAIGKWVFYDTTGVVVKSFDVTPQN